MTLCHIGAGRGCDLAVEQLARLISACFGQCFGVVRYCSGASRFGNASVQIWLSTSEKQAPDSSSLRSSKLFQIAFKHGFYHKLQGEETVLKGDSLRFPELTAPAL